MITQEEQIQQVHNEREELARAYRSVFNTTNSDVKLVLEDMKKGCFYNKTTFVKGDPHHTFLNEGARLFLLSLLDKLK